MDVDLETTREFALRKGRNVSNRLVEEILLAVSEQLIHGRTIRLGDRNVIVTVVAGTGVGKRGEDETASLLFDVRIPGHGFDHIEFKVSKTGWGMSQQEEKTKP